MAKILVMGVKPVEQTYVADCRHCGTKAAFTWDEACGFSRGQVAGKRHVQPFFKCPVCSSRVPGSIEEPKPHGYYGSTPIMSYALMNKVHRAQLEGVPADEIWAMIDEVQP